MPAASGRRVLVPLLRDVLPPLALHERAFVLAGGRLVDAIPTEYAGVRFRSRLEARRAAMFDLLAWPWQYEPVDLRAYIPDFLVGTAASQLLVECKPTIGEDWADDAAERIGRARWAGGAVVLGSDFSQAGVVVQPALYTGSARFAECVACGGTTLAPPAPFWACLRHPGHDAAGLTPSDPATLALLWRAAGNETQWRKR